MKPCYFKLLPYLFAVLLSAFSNVTFANDGAIDSSKPYTNNPLRESILDPIFKFTDSDGKITYSSSFPHEFVTAEKMSLLEAPSSQDIKKTLQITRINKITANKLGEAQKRRQLVRDEKEKRRQEKLRKNRPDSDVIAQSNVRIIYPHFIEHEKLHHKKKLNRNKPKHTPHLPHRISILHQNDTIKH